jgi:predicted Zn-ribbon and HTH transcriptional regulator
MIKTIEIQEFDCLKCLYHWVSRLPVGEKPKQCPNCKSQKYDEPRIKGVKQNV